MKFSILIPAYKSLFFRDALKSVLEQSYTDLELIIVDDCSPENLNSVVKTFSDSRIHYFRNDNNTGAIDVVKNWNKCLSYATGDYVLCMGDDDMLAPSCLADYCGLIHKYPNLYVYHTRTILIDEESNMYEIQEQRPEYESGFSLWWHRWNGRNKQYIGDFLFERRNLVDNGGFFYLPLAWASDDITAVRAAIPKGIANSNVPGFYYRQSIYTISMSGNERLKADSSFLEEEWYRSKLASACTEDNVDILLIQLISRNIDIHFQKKRYLCMMRDLHENPIRVLKWMKNNRKFQFKYASIANAFFRSLFRYVFK